MAASVARPEALVADPYQSRVGDRPGWVDRREPVVYSGGPAPGRLSSDERNAFERDGFLFFEGLLGQDEIAELLEEAQQLTESPDVKRLSEAVREPESDKIRSLFRVHRLSRRLDQLSRDRRILDVARCVLGSDVWLHQSRINLKPGFSGRGFYWHSDFETWHMEDGLPGMRTLSASILLTENFPLNGPLMLIPGSHKTFVSCIGSTPERNYRQSLRRQLAGIPDEQSLRRLIDRGGLVAPTGPPGSVLFFDCNLMHGSGSNITPYPRSNVFFVYNSVENPPQAPFCGQKPRPEHIAARRDLTPVLPLNRGEHALSSA